MSVRVEGEGLRDQVARHGPAAYLLTVTDTGTPHAVAVRVVWDGERLAAAVGASTAANAGARPDVTLLWPPVDDEGYSLIVDGRAAVDGDRVAVTPGRAVLHRPRAEGPGSDCVRLDGA